MRPTAWQPPRLPGILGLVVACGAILTAALVGGSSATVRLALGAGLVAGGALASSLVRPPARASRGWGITMQLVLALACAAPLALLDPLALPYLFAARDKLYRDAASRRAGVQEVMRLGRDLSHAPLADADLSGLDMTGADLRGADLTHANLTRAVLTGADVSDALLDDALLAGADLRQVNLASASVASATCDLDTRLPDGWLCREKRVTRSP